MYWDKKLKINDICLNIHKDKLLVQCSNYQIFEFFIKVLPFTLRLLLEYPDEEYFRKVVLSEYCIYIKDGVAKIDNDNGEDFYE